MLRLDNQSRAQDPFSRHTEFDLEYIRDYVCVLYKFLYILYL